jgi:hypothetical protein
MGSPSWELAGSRYFIDSTGHLSDVFLATENRRDGRWKRSAACSAAY